MITDSFGRAWRNGQVDVAIGVAGLAPLEDWRGRTTRRAAMLNATWIASPTRWPRQPTSRAPRIRASRWCSSTASSAYVTRDDGPGAAALQRPPAEDLFA